MLVGLYLILALEVAGRLRAAAVSTLWSDTKPAGAQTFTFAPDPSLAPGEYTVAIVAVTAAGSTVSASVPVTVDSTLTSFTPGPAIVSLARGATPGVAFTLASGPVQVQLDVKLGDEVVATPFSGSLDAGSQSLSWDGKLADGTPAPRAGSARPAGDGRSAAAWQARRAPPDGAAREAPLVARVRARRAAAAASLQPALGGLRIEPGRRRTHRPVGAQRAGD